MTSKFPTHIKSKDIPGRYFIPKLPMESWQKLEENLDFLNKLQWLLKLSQHEQRNEVTELNYSRLRFHMPSIYFVCKIIFNKDSLSDGIKS